MMFSIENRSPFLDVNLFDFAYSIPLKFLIMDGYGKFPLRKSLKGILNDKVRLERRKKGFNASISSLFDFKDKQTRELLLSDGPIFDIVRKDEISKLLDFDFFENSYKKFLFNFINAKFFLERFA
jgi:asparagine synthase (glutamine-hydrolysing)